MNVLGKINFKMVIVLVVLSTIAIFYGCQQTIINNTLRSILE